MGPVFLTVADLERTIDYWTTAVGLEVIERGAGEALLGSGEPGAGGVPRGAGRTAGAAVDGPVPRRAAAAGARGSRAVALARDPRPGGAGRRVGPLRLGGALPPRSRPPRHRDLRRSPARAVGGPRRPDGHRPARRREPARRAGRSRRRPAGRRCRPGTIVGHTHLQVGVDPATRWPSTATCWSSTRWSRSARRPRSSRPAATTTTSAATRGTASAPARPRRARPRSSAPRSCCRMRRSATAWWRRSRTAGQDPESRDDGVQVRDPAGNALLLTV